MLKKKELMAQRRESFYLGNPCQKMSSAMWWIGVAVPRTRSVISSGRSWIAIPQTQSSAQVRHIILETIFLKGKRDSREITELPFHVPGTMYGPQSTERRKNWLPLGNQVVWGNKTNKNKNAGFWTDTSIFGAKAKFWNYKPSMLSRSSHFTMMWPKIWPISIKNRRNSA